MIYLMNIALVLWLPLQTAQHPASPAALLSDFPAKYCNETFRFCIEFSKELLPLQFNAASGNGFILRSEDQFAEATVFGFLNPESQSPRQLFEQFQKQISTPENQPVVVSTLFGEDYYEGYFLVGERSFFQQVFFFEGYYIRLNVEAPVSQPAVMEQLRKQLNVEFLMPEEEVLPLGSPGSTGVQQPDRSGSN